MSASNFRDLEGWNKARDLTLDVYKFTADRPLEKDFGLRDQMRKGGSEHLQQYCGRQECSEV